jgi:TolB-like protein/Flp pilus assembly protein TadD
MFTDMVSFSALSQRNEALALELLEEQRAVIRRILAPHDGREVKTIGDGFLIEFPSALEAVQAALDMQTALHDRNANTTAERHILVRIGIHVGDVVSRQGDIHGDGVNIASRLEPLALPGGICVSEDVERQVRNKFPYATTMVASTELKNISLPVRVHRVVLPWEPSPARVMGARITKPRALLRVLLVLIGLLILGAGIYYAKSRTAPPLTSTSPVPAAPVDRKSVAVLAFANLSDDKSNEYFSDGISDELLNVLSKVPGLKVSARTSAFYFKGKQVPLAEIARQLGVAYVVEGSVRKSGDRLRITAQLVNAADGFHVWSDNFDRDLKDVFAVQDEIAGLIAKNLQIKIEAGNALTRVVNPQALELYLHGRQLWNLRTTEALARAEDLFRRALAIDPDFARAYTGLADVWIIRESTNGDLGLFGMRNSPLLGEIIAQIDRAISLDPDSAEAYTSLGSARWNGWKFAEAESALRRAITLNPNYATAHHWLGRMLMSDGRVDESIRELARAAELDPLSPRILDNYALALQVQGNLNEALAVTERALALQPDSSQAAVWRAVVLSELGRNREALDQIRQIPSDLSFYAPWIIKVQVAAGDRSAAEQTLRLLPPQFALLKYAALAALGRPEEALASLSPNYISVVLVSDLYVNPDLDPIRSNPRFVQLLATLGRTEANSRAQAWRASNPNARDRPK